MNNNYNHIADFYQCHYDEIVDFIAMRIQDRDEAQDMVQDLFLRLLSCHHIIDNSLSSLVYTMARNMVTDYFRRRHSHEEYEHYIRHSNDSDTSMESVFSARQLMERMEFSLARLPEECREVYRLHIYGGMKVGEISQTLGEDYKHVEYQLGLARKTVRQHLKACV